jgi:Iron-containing alcohol dehydrogenase
MRFVHDTLPQRVCFDSGEASAHLEREVAALGASRVMVIAAKEESNIADGITGGLRVVLRHDDVVMHVPVDVAARAREAAATHNIDAIVSVGGAPRPAWRRQSPSSIPGRRSATPASDDRPQLLIDTSLTRIFSR